MSFQNWNKFIQATKNRQPISLLIEAVEISGLPKELALDLGCGAGVDVKYMAENSFIVEAVDSDRECAEHTRNLCKDLPVSVFQKDISDYKIGSNTYSLILSWNALPFTDKKEARQILLNIEKGLINGGIFVFGIFGTDDDWAKTHQEMSFFTVEELKTLLPKMEFIKLFEKKQKKPGATGEVKFWHLIRGIAKKVC